MRDAATYYRTTMTIVEDLEEWEKKVFPTISPSSPCYPFFHTFLPLYLKINNLSNISAQWLTTVQLSNISCSTIKFCLSVVNLTQARVFWKSYCQLKNHHHQNDQ